MKKQVTCIMVCMLLSLATVNYYGIADENSTNKEKLIKIKNAIKKNDAQWTADFNNVFTPGGKNFNALIGCQKDIVFPEECGMTENSCSFPDSFDWRNVNGKDYITSVKNQGLCGSCVSFATLGAFEAIVQISLDEIFDCDLSEAYMQFCGGNGCNGWTNHEATDFIKDIGVVDEQCFVYEPKEMECDEKESNWKQRLVKAVEVDSVSHKSIKQSLIKHGPHLGSFFIYEDFPSYTGGIYEHVWGSIQGGHSVAIIGYNDDPGYWICKNSWGKEWGEDGFFRIKYGECKIDIKAYYFTGVHGNIPPSKPENVNPSDGSSNIDTSVNITWEKCHDFDGDSSYITYTTLLNEGNTINRTKDPLIENSTNTFFQVTNLTKNTEYSMIIIATDEQGSQHASDNICFTTILPSPPFVEGPTKVKKDEECTYIAYSADEDGENYQWFFSWGDGEYTGWLGPYAPGERVSASHTWEENGNYTVHVRYKEDGILSAWGSLKVTIPKTKENLQTPLFRLLDNHPILSLLFQRLINIKQEFT